MADVTGVPSGASAVCEPPALQAAETHPSQTPRVRISGWGILLGCFLVYQGAALLSFADREVAHDIPRSYDQAVYLAESYRIFTSMQAHGVLDGLFSSLQYSPPAGVLMEPLAALAYTVVGPTRMTALGLNVFAALAYMAITSYVLTRWRGPFTAAVAIGIFMGARTLENQAGGFADFRFDFIAMCAWGVVLALTLFQPVRSRWGSGVLRSIAGLALILCRTITLVYIIPMYAIILCVKLAQTRRRTRSPETTRTYTHELVLYGVPLLVWIIVGLLAEMPNFQRLITYYVAGHILNVESQIRAAEQGIRDLQDSLFFYPRSLIMTHLGQVSTLLIALVACSCVAWMIGLDRRLLKKTLCSEQMAILAVAALIPYVALTSDQAKSPVVGDIFVPIAAMFGALLIGQLNQTGVIERSRSTRVFVASVGGAVFAIGLSTQLGSLLAGQIPPPDREHLPEADRLAVTAGDYIQNYLGGSATWSTDAHLDYDFSQAVTAYYFERTGRLLHIRGTALGDGAVDNVLSRTDVLNVAASTDVMVLPDDDTPVHSIYPSDIMIASMLPELRSYASAHMRPLDSFQLFGRSVSVYVRIDPDVQSGTE